MTDAIARSASALMGPGSAWVSFCIADTKSGDSRPATAAIISSDSASGARSPVRSVRAPPSSRQPPWYPRLEYTGMPAELSASRSRRAVRSLTSSSAATSRAVTVPRAWSRSRVATRRSARMNPSISDE